MSKGFALFAILLMAAGGALAVSPPELLQEAPRAGDWLNDNRPTFSPSRQDTIWFGKVGVDGLAVEGEWWDFDDNTLQGFTVRDFTDNLDIWFNWVVETDFDGDVFPSGSETWAPMMDNTAGMIWCGIHTQDANLLDYANGLGYGNDWCQRARSPIWEWVAGNRVNVEHDYFSWSEVDYDYIYVNLIPYGGASGDSMMADNILQLAKLDGYEEENGDYTAPAFGDYRTRPLDLPPTSTSFQLEYFFKSDGGWSDEDGRGDCPYGACAFDNVSVFTEDSPPSVDVFYDFDDGPQGWIFEKCPAVGSFMQLIDAATVDDWMVNGSDLICGCDISGYAMHFNSIICDDGYPGVLSGTNNMIQSPVIPRGIYQPPAFNEAIYRLDQYNNLPQKNGCLYRPGYRFYPYTSEVYPEDHWSPRQGQSGFWYTGSPWCALTGQSYTTMDDQPLPGSWDSLMFVYEIYSSCDGFGIPSSVCTTPGCGVGSPVLDNIRVGLTGSGVDAPAIGPAIGNLFMDGFGQNYPTYLEPSDRGNSNITYDAGMVGERYNDTDNDWNLDSSVVAGPLVLDEESEWLAQLCFRVATVGPRQHWVPEYHTWKSRFSGDPELDWVCVLMDSVQVNADSSGESNRFVSYFHEEDPGFDPNYEDYTEEQEILPDGIFTPGTSIEYQWRAYWYRDGAPPDEYFYWPAEDQWREYGILPLMEDDPDFEYRVRWPSILYIDAFNRGGEDFLVPLFDQENIIYDKFDYLDASSNWHAPMKRKFGGESYNPGGWSNSGCTTEQLLAYRLIFLNTGYLGPGCMETHDYDMFAEWAEWTECGFDNIRRGFIADGDEIVNVMCGDEGTSVGEQFAFDILGVQMFDEAYREANNDSSHCTELVGVTGTHFAPEAQIRVYNNGCPGQNNYNVIEPFPASGALGNWQYYSYLGQGDIDYVDFSMVTRDNQVDTNMRTAVTGFSFHHVSLVGCVGEQGQADCRQDSLCISQGAAAYLRPTIDWIEDDDDLFVKWLYPCTTTDVDEDDVSRITGPVNHLYQSRPNPFNSRATIRFQMASQGHVDLDVYDVSGRLVKTLVDGDVDAGENSVVWDGTDNGNHRVGGGIFWVQMRTKDGYTSGKQMLVLR